METSKKLLDNIPPSWKGLSQSELMAEAAKAHKAYNKAWSEGNTEEAIRRNYESRKLVALYFSNAESH